MEIDIERQVEKITNVKTKEMFTEVYQLYAIHNYRACIVMLWSCIVCDLLYKFRQLNLRSEKAGVIFPLSDYWPII